MYKFPKNTIQPVKVEKHRMRQGHLPKSLKYAKNPEILGTRVHC